MTPIYLNKVRQDNDNARLKVYAYFLCLHNKINSVRCQQERNLNSEYFL
nr:MAG TPA: hypothetical protein [Caudoviricetes sp.]